MTRRWMTGWRLLALLSGQVVAFGVAVAAEARVVAWVLVAALAVVLVPLIRAARAEEPGTATITRHDDGTRTVLHADPVIRVATELLAGELDRDVIEPDGTLRLDTTGEYRYRYVRDDGEHWRIYERITDGGAP